MEYDVPASPNFNVGTDATGIQIRRFEHFVHWPGGPVSINIEIGGSGGVQHILKSF